MGYREWINKKWQIPARRGGNREIRDTSVFTIVDVSANDLPHKCPLGFGFPMEHGPLNQSKSIPQISLQILRWIFCPADVRHSVWLSIICIICPTLQLNFHALLSRSKIDSMINRTHLPFFPSSIHPYRDLVHHLGFALPYYPNIRHLTHPIRSTTLLGLLFIKNNTPWDSKAATYNRNFVADVSVG